MDEKFIPWHKRSLENAEAFRKTQREAKQRRTLREPEKVYEERERSRAKHKDKHLIYLKKWQKEWYEANKKELMPRRIARVRAREKGLDTPIARMYLPQTEEFYREARRLTEETGISHVVDHYWPVNGKNSCGLHVPWNLRVITGAENSAKGDKEPEDTWSSITIEQGD
jgi:hypothetical protein